MSRLETIGEDADTYARYTYLGAGKIVVEDYEDIEVKLDYADNNFAALDRFGRVQDQIWTDYGAYPDVVIDHYTYTYDRAGNRLTRDNVLNDDLSETYTYNDLDELISTERNDDYDQSWTLDALGNFSEFDDDGSVQTRDVNAANEIIDTTGISTPTYDLAGNMTSDGTLKYYYDAWNRQTFVSLADDSSVAIYSYDGLSRRIQKTGFTTWMQTDYYYNNNWQLIEQRHIEHIVLIGDPPVSYQNTIDYTQYVWSPSYIDSPVVRLHDGNADGDLLDAGDNIRYYTTDANHNVTATIDAGSGNVVERYVYNAYGKTTVYSPTWTNPAAPTTDGPLYCGYFFDAETGNYQVRNRYYSTNLGIFISRDPIGYKGGDVNLYRYVGNDPTNAMDPMGMEPYPFPPGYEPPMPKPNPTPVCTSTTCTRPAPSVSPKGPLTADECECDKIRNTAWEKYKNKVKTFDEAQIPYNRDEAAAGVTGVICYAVGFGITCYKGEPGTGDILQTCDDVNQNIVYPIFGGAISNQMNNELNRCKDRAYEEYLRAVQSCPLPNFRTPKGPIHEYPPYWSNPDYPHVDPNWGSY